MTAKWALVTGGNRGLGLEICKQLVAAGKPVLLTARNTEQGAAVAASLATPAAAVRCLQLDAADAGSIKQLAERVKQDYDQQVDLLVNNAGILFRGTWDAEAFTSTLTTNTVGPIAVSQALLPHLAPQALIIMVSSGLGSLSNVSSDYAEQVQAATTLEAVQALAFSADSPMGSGAPGFGSMAPAYSVSKAALNKAVQLMAAHPAFTAHGVRVVSTCPGWCRTDMGGSDAERSAEKGAESILWPWAHWADGLNATFTRDGEQHPW